MNYVMIAVSWCLYAQPAGEVEPFESIPLRARQAAPPAVLDDAPDPSTVPENQPAAVPSGEPTPAASEPPPADDPWADLPAADGAPERPDRDRSNEHQPRGEMESLGARPQQKLRPPELIAEALENPRQEALAGTPLSMSQALARVGDRGQQLRIAQSYWRLAAAQAEYHWALEQRDALADHTQPHADLAGPLGARAAAEADVRDAQLLVEQSQQQLAQLLRPGDASNLPLTIDRPHVGDYRTHYQDIFGSRVPPPRIRLIHRTLPMRRKAIDAHADAIVAAIDAVDASGEQFRASGQGLSTLLGSVELLGHQRRAFIAEVRQYNLDIAEYALTVAPAGAHNDTLVAMLIRTTPLEGRPARAPDGAVDPPSRRTLRNPLPKKSTSANDPDDWTSNYPHDAAASAADDPGMYQALLAVSHYPLRVQKLGNLLHWDRNLPPETGQPAALAECLQGVAAAKRLAVIRAFWQTRERAARFQVFSELAEQLNTLQSIAIPQRDQPGMAGAGVRLQAARRSARAAILDAQLDLLAAQFELTQLSGRSLADPWLLPSTPPQSGRYLTAKRSERGARWAGMTVREYDKLRHRAEAVIQCDAHRAEMIALARRNENDTAADDQMTPLDRVLWATKRQNQQTLAFLDDLTGYNMAIANFALIALPASLSGEELAGRLAIARSTLRGS